MVHTLTDLLLSASFWERSNCGHLTRQWKWEHLACVEVSQLNVEELEIKLMCWLEMAVSFLPCGANSWRVRAGLPFLVGMADPCSFMPPPWIVPQYFFLVGQTVSFYWGQHSLLLGVSLWSLKYSLITHKFLSLLIIPIYLFSSLFIQETLHDNNMHTTSIRILISFVANQLINYMTICLMHNISAKIWHLGELE